MCNYYTKKGSLQIQTCMTSFLYHLYKSESLYQDSVLYIIFTGSGFQLEGVLYTHQLIAESSVYLETLLHF